jgi:hypothetical protein
MSSATSRLLWPWSSSSPLSLAPASSSVSFASCSCAPGLTKPCKPNHYNGKRKVLMCGRDWCFARNEGPPTNACRWGLNDVRRIQTGSMVEIVPLAPRRHWWCRRLPLEQPRTTKAKVSTNTKPRTMTRRELSYHGDFATLPAPPARSYQSPAHRYKGEGTLIFDADAYNKV